MSEQLEPLDRLVQQLSKLPGVGTKSAMRLAFFLLKQPSEEALALAHAITDLKENVHHCSICSNISGSDVCSICSDAGRDQSTICVVEQPFDLMAIDKTGEYRGVYHVLTGVLSPINGIGPDDLTIDQLEERVNKGGIKEIIIATNPTLDGEATALYIAKQLAPAGVTVSRIALGLPVGSNLEHADRVTMARSISARQVIDS